MKSVADRVHWQNPSPSGTPIPAYPPDAESASWQRADKYFSKIHDKYSICAYPQTEAELPLCMEQYGFRNVSTEYITVNLTPDNPCYPPEMAHAMISANRRCSLDNIESLLHIADNVFTPSEIEEMKRLVNAKYDKRISLYNEGIKQWDTNMSVTMIVRGVK